MNVKVAGSMLPFVNAARQRSELLAKAIIARNVSMKIRRDLSIDGIQRRTVRCKCIMINQLELVKRYQSVQRFSANDLPTPQEFQAACLESGFRKRCLAEVAARHSNQPNPGATTERKVAGLLP